MGVTQILKKIKTESQENRNRSIEESPSPPLHHSERRQLILAAQIDQSFVYGSVAKGKDSAKSDVDLMVISEKIAYSDLFAALEPAMKRLQRTINPTMYSRLEIHKRILDGNAFVKRVLAQPKLWVIGESRDLAA